MSYIVHAVAELDVTKPTFTFKENQWSESTLIRRDSLWPLHLLSTPPASPRVLVVHYTQSSQVVCSACCSWTTFFLSSSFFLLCVSLTGNVRSMSISSPGRDHHAYC